MRNINNNQSAEDWIPTGIANNNLMNHQSPVNTADNEAERCETKSYYENRYMPAQIFCPPLSCALLLDEYVVNYDLHTKSFGRNTA